MAGCVHSWVFSGCFGCCVEKKITPRLFFGVVVRCFASFDLTRNNRGGSVVDSRSPCVASQPQLSSEPPSSRDHGGGMFFLLASVGNILTSPQVPVATAVERSSWVNERKTGRERRQTGASPLSVAAHRQQSQSTGRQTFMYCLGPTAVDACGSRASPLLAARGQATGCVEP